MRGHFFNFLYFFFAITCFGQTGELDRFDCNYSKEIIVPFNYSENAIPNKPQLNQVAFYSYRDQFTYWYKVVAKSNETLNFKVSAINDSDSYAVYVYQYNNGDFCSKLYNQKIKPITQPFYVGIGSEQIVPKQNVLKVQKGNCYYISVLNTSLNNCGHYLNFSYGSKDTLKVKALHLPCKKDVTTIPVILKAAPGIKPKLDSVIVPKAKVLIAEIKDSIKVPIYKTDAETDLKALSSVVQFIVKDKNKLNVMNSNLIIINTDTKEYITIENKGLGKWETILEKDKKYKIKSTAFGYTDLEMYTDINKETIIELLMEPLKVGDNFIMKSIYFHPNTYALRRESIGELQALLNYMTNNASVSIEIQGHTNGDNRIYKNKAYQTLGEEWNFKGSSKDLSLKRSEVIKKYLVNNGIGEERLFPKGCGGSKPIIVTPETMEEGQRNIRVEVVILKN